MADTVFFSVDRQTYKIQIPLPPKIDPSVTMMQVEEKPDVTYADVGGCKEQIEKLREVVELPLLEVRNSACISWRLTPSSPSVLRSLVSTLPRVSCCMVCRSAVSIKSDLLRSSGNWQDALCPSCSQSYRRDFYPCHRFRACAEIRR